MRDMVESVLLVRCQMADCDVVRLTSSAFILRPALSSKLTQGLLPLRLGKYNSSLSQCLKVSVNRRSFYSSLYTEYKRSNIRHINMNVVNSALKNLNVFSPMSVSLNNWWKLEKVNRREPPITLPQAKRRKEEALCWVARGMELPLLLLLLLVVVTHLARRNEADCCDAKGHLEFYLFLCQREY